jgi:hypothetical protein
MEELLKMVADIDPQEALAELADALKTLFAGLDEETRTQFVLDLVGKSEGDKVSSLVHL